MAQKTKINQAEKAVKNQGLLARFLIAGIRFYQLFLSPMIQPRCRYQPTCSHYAIEAVRVHGGRKGFLLAIRRLARCHPWGGMGYDPVPEPSPAGRAPQVGNKTPIEAQIEAPIKAQIKNE